MWGILIFAVIAAGIFASDIFWELLTGMALVGIIAGAAQLEPGLALTGIVLMVVCCARWTRFPV